MSRLALTALAALALSAPALADPPPPAEVRLLPTARLTCETVTLGDVAQVSGTAAQRKLLRALPLGALPPAGRSRVWSRSILRVRLRAAGLEAALSGAKSVRVRGRYLTISASHQLSLAAAELKTRDLSAGAPLGKVRSLHVRLEGTIGLTATLIRRSRRELRVRITAQSGTARVEQVLRLRRAPSRAASARKASTRETSTRKASARRRARRAPATRPEVAPARLEVAPAGAEAPAPRLVKAGQQVTVVARRGAIELTLRGRARTSGARDATVRVRLEGVARRTVSARVTGPGQVTLLEGTF